jgi:hypothetical protein
MRPLNDPAPALLDLTDWWTDDEGTLWPPCLATLLKSQRHRARLRERAASIANPQLIAYALHYAHQTKPIISLEVLKESFDQMGKGGYIFSAAIKAQAAATSRERLHLSPTYIPGDMAAPLAKVYQFPIRETESSDPLRQTSSVPNHKLRQSHAHAEVCLQKEMEQSGVPTNVEACRQIIRQTLGIRRRRIWDKDVKDSVQ